MKINKELYISKMKVFLTKNNIVKYYLNDIYLNDYLGKQLHLEYLSKIRCIHCHQKIKKSFNQGYCFICMRTLAVCDICIIKPELCHYEQGTCRDSSWARTHCLQPHYVYLAHTSNIKIGITQKINTPMRWIDQGAIQALPILQTNQRFLSGLIEVKFKKYISDKTNWKSMLKSQPKLINLYIYRDKIFEKNYVFFQKIQQQYGLNSIQFIKKEIQQIYYPVLNYPEKIKSFNLDKIPYIKGKLIGIKGQYIILNTGVINFRKFSGYLCKLIIE